MEGRLLVYRFSLIYQNWSPDVQGIPVSEYVLHNAPATFPSVDVSVMKHLAEILHDEGTMSGWYPSVLAESHVGIHG